MYCVIWLAFEIELSAWNSIKPYERAEETTEKKFSNWFSVFEAPTVLKHSVNYLELSICAVRERKKNFDFRVEK